MIMKANHFVMIAIFLCLMVFVSTTTLAYDVQQKYINTTGVTAFDLTKVLAGDVNVTNAIHDKFAQHEVKHPEGVLTTIHWHDGQVLPGEWTWACFSVHPGRSAVVRSAAWTDANGTFIGPAGPAMSTRANYRGGRAYVDVSNQWVELVAAAYPIEDTIGVFGSPYGTVLVTDVYYSFADQMRPLEELNDALINSPPPDVNWVPLSPESIGDGLMAHWELGVCDIGQVVLFRFAAAGGGMNSQEIIQFQVDPTYIPSLTEWGLIIFGVLLVGLMVYYIVRRRKASPMAA